VNVYVTVKVKMIDETVFQSLTIWSTYKVMKVKKIVISLSKDRRCM